MAIEKTVNEMRISAIDLLLHELDGKSIRALRAGDAERLVELENAAVILRADRATLIGV